MTAYVQDVKGAYLSFKRNALSVSPANSSQGFSSQATVTPSSSGARGGKKLACIFAAASRSFLMILLARLNSVLAIRKASSTFRRAVTSDCMPI